MTALTYAGIGARATPSSVCADMTVIARWLARTRVPATGWHLHSGGAKGADSAFAEGAPAGQRTIFLPWPGYNGHLARVRVDDQHRPFLTRQALGLGTATRTSSATAASVGESARISRVVQHPQHP